MDYEQVVELLQKAGLPYAYDHFEEGEAPDPPFLVYLYPTTVEMASILRMSPAGIRKNLSALRDGGYIERAGSRKTGSWKVLR